MRKKLGLLTENSSDADLFSKLFETMRETHSDFTTTFLLLQSAGVLGMEFLFNLFLGIVYCYKSGIKNIVTNDYKSTIIFVSYPNQNFKFTDDANLDGLVDQMSKNCLSVEEVKKTLKPTFSKSDCAALLKVSQ